MEGYNSDIRKLYPESRLCATWLLWTCARRDAVRGPKMASPRVARRPARHIVAHEVDHRPPSRGSMHGDAVEFLFASFGAQPRAGARALETG